MRLLAGLVLCLAAVGASASLYTEGSDVVVIASSADLKATLKPGAGALVEFYAPWQVPGSGSPELRCWGPAGGALILRRAQGVVQCAASPGSSGALPPLPPPVLRRCRRCTAPPHSGPFTLPARFQAGLLRHCFNYSCSLRTWWLPPLHVPAGCCRRSFPSIRPPHPSASLRSCRCGHCKNLKPEWTRAAQALKGILPVAAVDADAHRDLGQEVRGQGWSCNASLYLRGAAHISEQGWGPGGPPARGPLAVD